ncbi:HlyD family efflux transporter periplasmic adaptor subunit [Sulfurimonas sp. HSL-1716]|uniref:HlyD family secretion protein n=1 Tax=Hydrocurvibacter sulfurireducens TaxID=3131937 RepID=UPI0031F86531
MIKKYGIYALVLILFFLASILIYKQLNPVKLSDNLVASSGNVDGDLIALNTKYPGRIDEIYVQDGQSIKTGDKVATLQSDEYEAQLRSLNDGINSAKEGLKALEQENLIAKESVPLEIKKAKKAVDIAVAQKKELEDSLSSLHQQLKQDEVDFGRNKTLFEKNLISQQKFEYSKLQLAHSKNSYSSQQQRLYQAQKSIDIANYTLTLALGQNKKLIALDANVDAAKNNIASLNADRDKLKIMINDLSIKSPIDGFVVEKVANKGEVLNSGMVVATLIDPKSLYLKIFIDTLQSGKIKVGDKAVIFLDAYPDKPIQAEVVRVAQKAEFTPKDVSVRSDRIQRVYAVHLRPLKVNPLLKLGIPAIGIVSLNGEDLPGSLSEIPKI